MRNFKFSENLKKAKKASCRSWPFDTVIKWSMSTQGHHLKKLVVLEYPMLYTKFQRHRPLGSEEDFIFLDIYGYGHMTWNFEQLFTPHTPWRLHMKFCFNQPSGFWRKEVWKCWIWVALDKSQWMTMTLSSHKLSCTHLFDYKYRLLPHRIHQFLGNVQFERFPIQKQNGPNLTLKYIKVNTGSLLWFGQIW